VAETQLAVLIDFENVGPSHIRWLLDQVSEVGRVAVKRAYGDWSTGKGSSALLELGIEPVQVFRTGSSGKNASDIRLTIDAIDLLHQSPVDVFVLASSDTDFIPLVSKLRAAGKMVIGAGRESAVGASLVKSCDRYHFLDRVEQVRRQGSTQDESLLIRAVKASVDAQGRVIGSKLYQTMQRLDPSFDFKALGHSNFRRYVEGASEVSVSRPDGSRDIIVELAEDRDQDQDQGQDQDQAWDTRVNSAWAGRAPSPGDLIGSRTAGAAAAKALGAPRLSATRYKNLQGLLDASPLLSSRWGRSDNKIVRSMPSRRR
jgi:uncharacterized protein (TIGR00288 family)